MLITFTIKIVNYTIHPHYNTFMRMKNLILISNITVINHSSEKEKPLKITHMYIIGDIFH